MNFIFYDFETSGRAEPAKKTRNGQWDQILQVGAILCNEDLAELDRFEMKCSLNKSLIPHPSALLVNNLSMSAISNTNNISNYTLVYKMMEKFKKWGPAIFIGYNSISFDEEFLRNALFQNLHENPYLTQINGNKRADLYNIVRAASLYIPTCLKIPDMKGSYRLENLAPANDINHEDAHDALADVIATIEISKIIKNQFPEFWRNSLVTSTKSGVSEILENSHIVCHHESYYGKIYPFVTKCIGKLGIKNRPEVFVCFDLKHDPIDYIDLSYSELEKSVFEDKLCRKIRNNTHPIIMGHENAMNFPTYEKIGADAIHQRADIIKNNKEFSDKILQILVEKEYNNNYDQSQEDILEEESLYSGGFPSAADKLLMKKFHDVEWGQKILIVDNFHDIRYSYLAKKIIYGHDPSLLNKYDSELIEKTIAKRLASSNTEKWLTIPEAFSAVDDLREKYSEEEDKLEFLNDYNSHLEEMLQMYQSTILTYDN
ncbi:MAG: exonuclease domain-containing protein [Hyphomicrobiales bacterium]|nr:exonuclease domain-containing protein [Hyphomicrobiales bacterium]